MKIKNVISLFLIVLIAILTLSACGNNDLKVNENGKNPSGQVGGIDNADTEENDADLEEIEVEPFSNQWNFKEQEILNEWGVSFVATPIDYSGKSPKWTIKLIATEPVGTKYLRVKAFTVNGLSLDPQQPFDDELYLALNEEVEATVPIYNDIAYLNRITEIQTLGIQFEVIINRKTEGYTKYVEIKTDGSESYVQDNPKDGEVIFEQDNIKITREGMDKTDSGMELLIYRVENNNPFACWVEMDCNLVNNKRSSKKCEENRNIPANKISYLTLPVTNVLSDIGDEKVEEVALEIKYNDYETDGIDGRTEQDLILKY